MTSIASPALWVGFNVFVFVLLMLDLFVFHRKAHEVSAKEALGWSAFWIALSFAFNGLVYFWFGQKAALEFATGYVIEKALSVDNLFVFLVIFGFFKVPKELQHRVLYWGVFGALVLRIIFILSGAALLQRFHFIIYIFGAFLVYTGAKLLFQKEEEFDPEHNVVLKLVRRFIPSVPTYRGTAFFIREGGKRYATPLFIVLIMIELTDIVFAVDSIPAIFAVTQDPFLVYSSNIFAILGLRALYFALAVVMDKFHYLKVGLAFVLMFVGAKMLIVEWYKVPVGLSLGVIVALLGGSIVVSLLKPVKE
jgi:tellurite resistance protein TerC